MATRYRCDEPMAEKKGMLKYCNKRCMNCLCAIKTDALGNDSHVHFNEELKQQSNLFTERNLDHLSGRLK